MQYSTRQLLCTFSEDFSFKKTIQEIKSFYEVYSNRIFAFSNVKNPSEVYLTYNVLDVKRDAPKFPNTILVHRKKQTNTLYSLNAMNILIKEECGHLDTSYMLDWNLYNDSLIIAGDISVRIIPLQIISIFN